MKLENLQRANDLAKMKKTTLEHIEYNAKALDYITSRTSFRSPISVDLTEQTEFGEKDNSKHLVHIYLYSDSLNSKNDVRCSFRLEILMKILVDEISRLKKRVKEIDKEIESL